MALGSVGADDDSDAAVNGGLRAVACSMLGAAYQVEEVEKAAAAAATLRELEATAGPEPSCRNAEIAVVDLEAKAIAMMMKSNVVEIEGRR